MISLILSYKLHIIIRHPLSVICHLSYVIYHLSSVIRHPSSVICHLSSVIRHPSSVIRHPSSVIRHPSSVIHHLSSVICHPSSVICHPSSVIHHLSSIICHLLTIYLFSAHPCSIFSKLDSENLHLVFHILDTKINFLLPVKLAFDFESFKLFSSCRVKYFL